jgi:hypothetical protein
MKKYNRHIFEKSSLSHTTFNAKLYRKTLFEISARVVFYVKKTFLSYNLSGRYPEITNHF